MLASEESLEGARVLDLYAGTGALAFEAISRGAVHATLVEKNRNALTVIAENVKALALEDVVRVHAMQVENVAELLGREPFDLIFADPPYADIPSGVVARALEPLVRAGAFSKGARFVLEHASRDELPPAIFPEASLELRRQRIYGDTAIAIFVNRS
jgi:16S rRNA (guanine966-N2)-methyltransferase